MKIVGLTGGIGSGKSTVARMFELLNVPVYYADLEAKKLLNESDTIKDGMRQLFGENAYIDNVLNRAYIAEIVFKDKEKLNALNDLIHPKVQNHFLKWVAEQRTPYIIQENPLIFEKQQQDVFDKIITVTADKELRIERVMARDSVSKDQVLDRMANQMEDREKIASADYVISNETLEGSKIQVDQIHQELLLDIS